MNQCTVTDCPNPWRGNGPWCNKHRQRAAKHGDPLGTAAPRADDSRERLRAKLKRNSEGCLIYTGATQQGYGVFSFRGRSVKAHRFAYEDAVGPIPAGHSLDHECHNRAYADGNCEGGNDCRHRACCEPSHLIPRLIWDNTSRGASATAINARKEECPSHHVPYRVIRVCEHCVHEAQERYRKKRDKALSS